MDGGAGTGELTIRIGCPFCASKRWPENRCTTGVRCRAETARHVSRYCVCSWYDTRGGAAEFQLESGMLDGRPQYKTLR